MKNDEKNRAYFCSFSYRLYHIDNVYKKLQKAQWLIPVQNEGFIGNSSISLSLPPNMTLPLLAHLTRVEWELFSQIE